MPKKLDDCVKDVMKQGYTEDQAYAICTTSTCYRRGKRKKWVRDEKWCKKYKEKRKKMLKRRYKKLLYLLFLLDE